MVRSEGVEALERAFATAEIGFKPYYRVPLHRQPALQELSQGVELPVTDELARTHLAIPMSPVLTVEQATAVTDAARRSSLAAPGSPLDWSSA